MLSLVEVDGCCGAFLLKVAGWKQLMMPAAIVCTGPASTISEQSLSAAELVEEIWLISAFRSRRAAAYQYSRRSSDLYPASLEKEVNYQLLTAIAVVEGYPS